jgi:hypothetical protein
VKVLASIALGAASLALVAQPAGAAVEATPDPDADAAPRRAHTYRISLKVTGEEYESADEAVLSRTNGEACPPPPVGSVQPRCWKWTEKHLGDGNFVKAGPFITLTDSRGAVLHVTWGVQRIVPDPTPQHAIGHVNRFVSTYTFTDGTERFAGVTGVLKGTGKSTILEVDPNTGIAHKKTAGTFTGRLTFPNRLR